MRDPDCALVSVDTPSILLPFSKEKCLIDYGNRWRVPIVYSTDSLCGLFTGLEVLDLSNNRFTGRIPNSLGRMESLIKLVLSNNLLFGLIPEFPEHVSVDTIGNTDLIYPTKPSPTQKTMKTLSVGLLVAVTSAVSTFVTFIGPAVFLSLYENAAQIQSEEHFSQPQVTSGSSLTPNGVHRSNTHGQCGVVFLHYSCRSIVSLSVSNCSGLFFFFLGKILPGLVVCFCMG